MVKVELTSASNGVIKRVVDDNYNGAGSLFSVTKVYPIEKNDPMAAHQSYQLLSDLVNDLGVDIGPEVGHRLVFRLDWGELYVPSQDELADRIRGTKEELRVLLELRNEMNPPKKTPPKRERKTKG